MMLRQAAEAVMAAYGDGVARQWVRLQLDAVCPPERVRDSGIMALHEAALPVAERFARSLQSDAALRNVRISLIDEVGAPDVGTLLYRETEDAAQDAAVFFLVGRGFAVDSNTKGFLDGMKGRLVVMLNSEDAASTFRVENRGQDFLWGGMASVQPLRDFCRTFSEQTYHYSGGVVNGWTTALFRAYPHPWEAYLEDFYGNLVLLAESEDKPDRDQIAALTAAYQEATGITEAEKRNRRAAGGA